MNGTVKLWLGVGVWVLASTSTAALLADGRLIQPALAGTVAGAGEGGEGGETGEARPAQPHNKADHKAGGEGGEGGEAGHASDALDMLSPDVAFATRLTLIRAHLRAGRELVEAGHMAEAHAHFMHPADEVYDDLKSSLKARGIRPFKSTLDALAQTVGSGNKDGFPAAFDAAQKAVDGAWAALPAASRDSASLAAETIAALTNRAAEEYTFAVTDGRIVDTVEYQDGRGLVVEAQGLFDRARAALRAKNPESTDRIGTVLADLATTFPAIMPPATAAKAPGEVTALASRIALVAGDFK